ncbi:MAG: hypothetical protein WCO25_05015 [Candidatus Uhrbacteria bacterium]
MKVFVGFHTPRKLVETPFFDPSVSHVVSGSPNSTKMDGCDAAVVFYEKFFATDMFQEDQRPAASDEVLRFGHRMMDRGVRVASIIIPFAIPIREIRRSFPDCYVSEQRHYCNRVIDERDLDEPYSHQWVHVWDWKEDRENPGRHQHLFLFDDPRVVDWSLQPKWNYFLNVPVFEAARAHHMG